MSRPFNVRFGNLSKTGATAVVMSLTSGDITLVVGGSSYTVTMSATGADRGAPDGSGSTTFGYYGTKEINFPEPFTVYNWSATQGSNTITGTQRSGPTSRDDFAVALTTCFTPVIDRSYATGWDFLERYRLHGALPLIAVLHADDIYYADGSFTTFLVGLSDENGKTPLDYTVGGRTQYDYALYYGAWFGICGPWVFNGFNYLDAAAMTSFMSLMDNTAFMPQWGDHEFRNNLGWTGGVALTTVPNPYHKTLGGYDGNGLVVYNQLMAPLQGTRARNRDVNANHWFVDFGKFRYIAPDPVTNAVNGVSCYGNNQIDDNLDLANGNQWFTWLGNSAVAGRGMPNYNFAHGLELTYKNENFIQAEYDRLMVNTGQNPKSFMDNPRTNGRLGGFGSSRGDWHNGASWFWQAAASGGKAAESFYEIDITTVNNSAPGATTTVSTPADLSLDSVSLEGGATKTDLFGTNKGYRMVTTIIEVYQSKPTPEMIVRQYDIQKMASDPDSIGEQTEHFHNNLGTIMDDAGNIWRCIFEKRIVLYAGNKGYDIGVTPWQLPQVSTSETLG